MLPCQQESGSGETRKKFGSPQSTQHLLPRVGEAGALRRLLSRKGWVQDFPSFSLHCQPSRLCRLLSGLICSSVSQLGVSVPSVCPQHVLALVWFCFP